MRRYKYDAATDSMVEITGDPEGPERAPEGNVRKYDHIVGWTQPTLKQVKEQGLVRAPRYDKKGRPVFTSRREIENYAAEVNHTGRNGHEIKWER